jgi:hypothetical protein
VGKGINGSTLGRVLGHVQPIVGSPDQAFTRNIAVVVVVVVLVVGWLW